MNTYMLPDAKELEAFSDLLETHFGVKFPDFLVKTSHEMVFDRDYIPPPEVTELEMDHPVANALKAARGKILQLRDMMIAANIPSAKEYKVYIKEQIDEVWKIVNENK